MGAHNKMTDDSISIFIEECNEILERLTVNAIEMEKGVQGENLIHGFYRDVHTMKGSAALYGFQALSRLAHAMESRLDFLRKQQGSLSSSETDLILQCVDVIAKILKSIQSGAEEDFDSVVVLLEQQLADPSLS